MKIADHYKNYTVPPIGSKLMISDLHLFGGEMTTVIENDKVLIVRLDSTGEFIGLVHRNHFNVIAIGTGVLED